MKIVIASDKFKGSLDSFQVAGAIEKGLRKVSSSFHIISLPMADGGDGLSEAVAYYTSAQWQMAEVQDPLGRIVPTQWLLSADKTTAFIEMAKASGLQLLKREEYNPLLTSTFGTGQFIKEAIQKGVEKIIIGIGGSATNDGGIGMAAALGYHFLDNKANELAPIGKNLFQIDHIDSRDKIDFANINFQIACDVRNPLLGVQGAARVYAPQKGADERMVEELEKGMNHFASVVERDLGIDIRPLEGGGAAGGLGAGCVAFLNAKLASGIELVMQLSSIEQHIRSCDWVITGEGRIDDQSLQGKVLSGVASVCKKHNKKLIAVCGSSMFTSSQLQSIGIDAVFEIQKPSMSLHEAINNAEQLTEDIAQALGKELLQHVNSK